MSPDDFKQYGTDNLLLLVGTNPLPNYVAGCLLADANTRIHWVMTPQVKKIAETLAACLGRTATLGDDLLEVQATDPQNIYTQVKERVRATPGTWGLHYTGGTKVMGMHVRRGLETALAGKADVVYSYLDAEQLRLIVEAYQGQAQQNNLKAQLAVALTFDTLFRLHGYPLTRHNPTARQPALAAQLARLPSVALAELDTFLNWAQHLPNPDDHLQWRRRRDEQMKLPVPLLPNVPTLSQKHAQALTDSWRAQDAIWNEERVVRWLRGQWLEHHVLQLILELKTEQPELHLGEAAQGLEPRGLQDKFEVDVAVLQGYRLFALSMTTAKDKGTCKLKLFEALTRARQMGGDEARVALVCGSLEAAAIAAEVGPWLTTQQQVKVFGLADWPQLKRGLRAWFTLA